MRNFSLLYQNGLTEDEIKIAYRYFEWFIEESFSGKQTFNLKTSTWKIDKTITPSWKHLTRGGHHNGRPLGRNELGLRCDWLNASPEEKSNRQEACI